MSETNKPLEERVLESKLGRYDLVKTALDWIEVKRTDEDYRRLPQAELLNKAVSDVVDGIATPEKIAEIRKKQQKAQKEEAEAKDVKK
ncbi:MAG: hypothetical protein FWC85_01830 [Elusimicrobia bacterium]|nr:hypothetical protein [Elusimicrobiota bacterium]